MGKRRPKGLNGHTRDFLRLQAIWDARLRRSGFVDIEQGMDLNEISSSTLPGSGTGSLVFVPEYELHDGADIRAGMEPGPVTNLAQAVLWRTFAAKANELPKAHPRRNFLITFAQTGNELGAARKHRLTRDRARMAVKKFCRRWGFDRLKLSEGANTTRGRPPAPTPAPVRTLTTREIRALPYTPPSKAPSRGPNGRNRP